jgi:hypothetical protein
MFNSCAKCGCTPTEAMVDAVALGLQNHYESGRYTCCQIADWATEQWEAWTDAAIQDGACFCEPSTLSPTSEPGLKHFLSSNDPDVPNWDAVAKLFHIEFIDC